MLHLLHTGKIWFSLGFYPGSSGGSDGKELPAMWETWVRSLGWEDLLEKEMATYSSILAGKSHGQRSLACYSPWGRKESGHD